MLKQTNQGFKSVVRYFKGTRWELIRDELSNGLTAPGHHVFIDKEGTAHLDRMPDLDAEYGRQDPETRENVRTNWLAIVVETEEGRESFNFIQSRVFTALFEGALNKGLKVDVENCVPIDAFLEDESLTHSVTVFNKYWTGVKYPTVEEEEELERKEKEAKEAEVAKAADAVAKAPSV